MTTKINIFNEGPGEIWITEREHDSENKVSRNKDTVLSTAQGMETYIWKEKDVLIQEKE